MGKSRKSAPVPDAILVISAHWLSKGTFVTAMNHPRTIHDFYGFPQELFNVQYPAPGNPKLAREIETMVSTVHVEPDHDWGLDHGAWSVVRRMYPNADIPVLQISIDYTMSPKSHYEFAQELCSLRKKRILIIGSGNMVHNLGVMNWKMIHGGGYDWAYEMNDKLKSLISKHDHDSIIQYERFGSIGKLAIPTPEHYLPLIYSLGLQGDSEDTQVFNDKAVAGSLTMTSLLIQ